MKNIANALLYNVAWFAAVWGASRGYMWLGSSGMLAFLVLHFAWVPKRQWKPELLYIGLIGLTGIGLDSAMFQLGAIEYPTSQEAWPWRVVPPWIAALWIGFATMPRFSLGWLKRLSVWVAVVFGAVGGPLAFYGGTRLGAIAPGWGGTTYPLLALEYGVLMPLMLRWHCFPGPELGELAGKPPAPS